MIKGISRSETAVLTVVVEAEDLVCQRMADARYLCAQGQLREAEKYYQQILQDAQQSFGARSWMVASVLCELAAFYASQDKHCSAKEYTERAFAIMRW